MKTTLPWALVLVLLGAVSACGAKGGGSNEDAVGGSSGTAGSGGAGGSLIVTDANAPFLSFRAPVWIPTWVPVSPSSVPNLEENIAVRLVTDAAPPWIAVGAPVDKPAAAVVDKAPVERPQTRTANQLRVIKQAASYVVPLGTVVVVNLIAVDVTMARSAAVGTFPMSAARRLTLLARGLLANKLAETFAA